MSLESVLLANSFLQFHLPLIDELLLTDLQQITERTDRAQLIVLWLVGIQLGDALVDDTDALGFSH